MLDGRLEPGDVLHFDGFEFIDTGETRNKFLVVMGEHPERQSVLYFIATSKEKHGRTRNPGCHLEYGARVSNYYLDPPKKKRGKFKHKTVPGFSKPTWVLLGPEQIEAARLIEHWNSGKATKAFSLPEHECRGIWQCFKRSMEFADAYEEFAS